MELEKVLEGIGIPVKYYEYAGVKPEYIVYNEEVEQPADYGDNDPECHITWWAGTYLHSEDRKVPGI